MPQNQLFVGLVALVCGISVIPSYPGVIPLLSHRYPNKRSISLLPEGVLLARCTWAISPFFTLNT